MALHICLCLYTCPKQQSRLRSIQLRCVRVSAACAFHKTIKENVRWYLQISLLCCAAEQPFLLLCELDWSYWVLRNALFTGLLVKLSLSWLLESTKSYKHFSANPRLSPEGAFLGYCANVAIFHKCSSLGVSSNHQHRNWAICDGFTKCQWGAEERPRLSRCAPAYDNFFVSESHLYGSAQSLAAPDTGKFCWPI